MIGRALDVLVMRFDPRMARRLRYGRLDRFSWWMAWREVGRMKRMSR